ncbi:MAG: hypothetical protein J6L72_04215 [Butyricicoccus sp.]|nr:hypothetical protein [Butyricicoccus sp.]
MNARLSQLIGWISLVLVFALVNAADCGSLTDAQMIWGSLLGICGLMTALLGQCLAVQRARRAQRPHAVPVRTERRPRRR